METEVTPQVSPPVTLHVREYGERSAPVHVMLVHGFPDDSRLWQQVVRELPTEWHVVTFDNRGAGRSSRPRQRSAYVLAMLLEDLIAVIDATVPAGQRVHLVGHDWGSVLGWDAVAASAWDPRLEDRLASYTSVSGPSFDHVASRIQGVTGFVRMLPQLLHSLYVLLFQLPVLPELWWRYGRGAMRLLVGPLDPTFALVPRDRETTANAVAGLALYRTNTVRRLRDPVPWRTSLPVQLLVLTRDGFVVPASSAGLEARCRHLTRVEVDAGHWYPRADPAGFADLVHRFVLDHL